jgi:zinc/manganese transport system substrate-binding protein
MPFRRSGAAAAALALLTLAGCGAGDTAAPATGRDGDARLSVVTSTNVYGSIAEAVGGDRVSVESLITDPAADPHSYESTPSDAAKVSRAAIVVFNGGGYDDWMPQLVESTGGGHSVIDVAELSGLAPAEEADEHAGESPDEHAAHEEAGHGELNEHFWYHLPTVQKIATRLAADLGAADAAHAAEYTANAEKFNGEVAALLTESQAVAAAHSGARVAITEPLPVYLIEAAGLTDVTPEEFAEAVEEDIDPPAAVLQETLALFAGNPVEALILNAQTQTPTTDQVRQAARTAGVPVVEVTETLPANETDYLTWMGAQIDALAGALNGA